MKTPLPVFRISFANASLLSGVYLLVAASTELIRRVWNPRWVEPWVRALESIPARTLQLLGLFEPLKEAWRHGQLSPWEVRLVYGATTVGVIFGLGVLVGVLMALAEKVFSGKSSHS